MGGETAVEKLLRSELVSVETNDSHGDQLYDSSSSNTQQTDTAAANMMNMNAETFVDKARPLNHSESVGEGGGGRLFNGSRFTSADPK